MRARRAPEPGRGAGSGAGSGAGGAGRRLGRSLRRLGRGGRTLGLSCGRGGGGLALGGLTGRLFGGLALDLFLGFALRAGLGLHAGALLRFRSRALLLGAEHRMALGDDLADRLGDQRARADRVVVAGNHEVDPVGVAVGVDQADDRDAQALGLFDGDHLGFEVDHEHRVGDALHVLDAAEVRAQLGQIGLRGHALARGQQCELALGLVAFEVVQPADALVDRLEVGEQPTEPAMVDVGHARGLGDVADRVARLLLGADEQDRAAAMGKRARELLGRVQER